MPTADPIVLGIDPGSLVTGYGVITQKGSRLIHIKSGAVKTSPRAPFQKRLQKIYEELYLIAKETGPSVLAIESVFYRKNVESAMQLSHARGVALLVAAQLDIPVAEYSPAVVKKSVVGYGRAAKEQISTMITHLFRLPPSEVKMVYDTCDAIAVALCHLNRVPLLAAQEKSKNSESPRRVPL